MRATRPRLARLSRVRNDMRSPPRKIRPVRIVCPTRTNGFHRGALIGFVTGWTSHGHQPDTREAALAEHEQLIADIMVAQQQLQRLFAYDRTDPLFNSHLTLTQIKILMLLS